MWLVGSLLTTAYSLSDAAGLNVCFVIAGLLPQHYTLYMLSLFSINVTFSNTLEKVVQMENLKNLELLLQAYYRSYQEYYN